MAKIYGKLNELREEIIAKIFENQDLLKFIFYLDSDKDIPTLPDLTGKQKAGLVNTKIFKHQKIDSTGSVSGCYLSFDFGVNPRDRSGYWSHPTVIFYILCDTPYIETENGSRIGALEQCVYNSFQGKDLGSTKPMSIVDSSPINIGSYCGRMIKLETVDWNGKK